MERVAEIVEIVEKGCLFGGMSVKEAVEKGSFTRCRRWGDQNSKSSETFSWVLDWRQVAMFHIATCISEING